MMSAACAEPAALIMAQAESSTADPRELICGIKNANA
jgi:hypothetical protein